MSDPVIRIENLGKKYLIDRQQQQQYSTLRDAIVGGVQNLFKPIVDRQFKFDRTSNREEFWALKDLSLEIKQGDRVGIIGRNGAGKSTLLKILSRITEPTCGRIGINGKVASLLEVGTGFHPELTGRENIFLNGAVLGMAKLDIARKFDEIVDFAEVAQFLDTPVKRYSSGMYVRLAFAVAAHLEPDILIVDEVLAVGDSQFQKKCLGKMQDISQGQGRTVLFVSHSIEAVQRLCSQCILLDCGQLIAHDSTKKIVPLYLAGDFERVAPGEWIDLSNLDNRISKAARFIAIHYSSLDRSILFQPYSDGPLEFLLDIEAECSQSIGCLAVTIYNQSRTMLVNADIILSGQTVLLHKGLNRFKLTIDSLHLTPGIYIVGLWMSKTGTEERLDYLESALEIEVINKLSNTLGTSYYGAVTCDFSLVEIATA
jgi:lipopolysaccharide transport system ATP-binding protein